MTTNYRISTITATASLNTEINLDLLYQSLKPICEQGTNLLPEDEGIVYIEFGKKKVETIYKGISTSRSLNNDSNNNKIKRFDNQVTIVYRANINGIKSMMNTKIFKNGNIQMTGIRDIDQGRQMVDNIANMIRNIYNNGEKNVVLNINTLVPDKYMLRLINSDFKIGYEIRREKLYNILCDTYMSCCSYEPCIYPAVKIKYYYNQDNARCDGNCYCSKKCIIGKSTGCGDTMCKKVTIAVFQSGCIIITGGQNILQVNEAYRFINRVLLENNDQVKRKIINVYENKHVIQKFMIKTENIKGLKV